MRTLVFSLVTVLLIALLAACDTSSSDDGDTDDVVDEPTEEVAATDDPTATSEAAEDEPTATPEDEAGPTATSEPAEDDPTATPEEDADSTATPEADNGDADGDGPTEHIIEMQDPENFDPSELEISVGDTITFVNAGNINHTTTLDPEIARDPNNAVLPEGAETWDSEAMEPGDEFSITLSVPGEYVYFCRPHEVLGMVGTINVTEGESSGSSDQTAANDSGNEVEINY